MAETPERPEPPYTDANEELAPPPPPPATGAPESGAQAAGPLIEGAAVAGSAAAGSAGAWDEEDAERTVIVPRRGRGGAPSEGAGAAPVDSSGAAGLPAGAPVGGESVGEDTSTVTAHGGAMPPLPHVPPAAPVAAPGTPVPPAAPAVIGAPAGAQAIPGEGMPLVPPAGAMPGAATVSPIGGAVAPPQPGVPEAAAAKQRSRTRRRIVGWSIAAVVLVLVVVAGFVTVHLLNQQRDPAQQVEEYLGYLEHGDAKAAGEMVDPGLKDGEGELLTDEQFDAAQERITVTSVETVERGGDGAEVRAKYTLGDERYEHVFHVEHGAKEWLVLDTWELHEPLLAEVTVDAGDPGTGVTAYDFGAVAIEASGEGESSVTEKLYPGIYKVTATGDEYTEPVTATVLAAPDDSETGAPQSIGDLQLNDKLSAEILGQAQDYADGCVAIDGNRVVKSNMDPACPKLTQNTQLDALRVTHRAEGFEAINRTSFTTEAFEFEVKATKKSSKKGAKPKTVTTTERYVLDGEIEWQGGKPVISKATFAKE